MPRHRVMLKLSRKWNTKLIRKKMNSGTEMLSNKFMKLVLLLRYVLCKETELWMICDKYTNDKIWSITLYLLKFWTVYSSPALICCCCIESCDISNSSRMSENNSLAFMNKIYWNSYLTLRDICYLLEHFKQHPK